MQLSQEVKNAAAFFELERGRIAECMDRWLKQQASWSRLESVYLNLGNKAEADRCRHNADSCALMAEYFNQGGYANGAISMPQIKIEGVR